jgi:hypothetical protein
MIKGSATSDWIAPSLLLLMERLVYLDHITRVSQEVSSFIITNEHFIVFHP